MRLLSVVVLAALAACSGGAQKTAESLASSAPTPLRDAALVATIATKLAAIDFDSATSVHVGVHGGLVTLTGQVRSPAVRAKFETAAHAVGGVRSVDDRTVINPKVRSVRESVSDAALLTKIDAVLLAQTGINALKVKTSVRDGVVTLTGAVPTAALRATMLDSVRTLGGVRTLIDRVTVRP
jgi:hyperosmotically inducible protein